MTTGANSMPEGDVRDRIRAFLWEEFLSESSVELRDETSLPDTGLIDSYAVLQINRFLLDQFGVKIPPHMLRPENYMSVNALAGMCTRLMHRNP